MKQATHIREELKTTAPLLAELSVEVPYKAPDGYFDQFALQMILKKETAFPRNPQSVPAGYFENFAGNMVLMAKKEESNQQSDDTPILNSIPKKMPYTVPDGYFEQLEEKLTAEAKPAVVKSINTLRRNIIRFSAAAAVVVMVLTGFWISNQSNSTNDRLAGKVPVESVIEEIDSESLTEYLENTAKAEEFAYYLIQPVDDIEESLESLPTEDLVKFLESSPSVDPGS